MVNIYKVMMGRLVQTAVGVALNAKISLVHAPPVLIAAILAMPVLVIQMKQHFPTTAALVVQAIVNRALM